MTTPTSNGTHNVAGYFSPRRLARDYGLVLPGFFLSLAAFIVLVVLSALSAGTFIVWIGALLFPLTLVIATGFARLSRTRLHWWRASGREDSGDTSATHPAQLYRPRGTGLQGWITLMADPRRWLDLLTETFIAFPLHVVTFAVSVSWGLGALGGITYAVWGAFIPRDGDDMPLPGLVLEAATNGLAPDALTHSFALDIAWNLVVGLVLLASLPAVVHGLAWLDALVLETALGVGPVGAPDPVGAEPAGHTAGEAAAGPADRHPGRPAGQAVSGHAPIAPSADGWAWILAGLAAAAGIAIAWPLLTAGYGVDAALGMLLALGQSTAVLVAVRWRGAAVALDTVVVIATVWQTAGMPGWVWPWPVVTMILHVITVLLIAIRGHWVRALMAWALPAAGATIAAVIVGTGAGGAGQGAIGQAAVAGLTPGAVANLIVAASVSAASCVIGIALRAWLKGRADLLAERRAAEELGAERAELAERNRIARELHDVVAHSMSVISVQATTAPYRLAGLDDAAKEEFSAIADSSRKALAEMRGLLAVLRADGSQAPTAPQPMLDDLEELVEATRASGAQITVHQEAPERLEALPAATSLTAYRIVQEGLSNAVRHSPGAAIDVVVRIAGGSEDPAGEGDGTGIGAGDHIGITVANGPVPPDASGTPRAPGAGLGLRGIRERAQALGGTVESGERPGGGWELHARLPL